MFDWTRILCNKNVSETLRCLFLVGPLSYRLCPRSGRPNTDPIPTLCCAYWLDTDSILALYRPYTHPTRILYGPFQPYTDFIRTLYGLLLTLFWIFNFCWGSFRFFELRDFGGHAPETPTPPPPRNEVGKTNWYFPVLALYMLVILSHALLFYNDTD